VTYLGASGSPLEDESGTFDLPKPTKPDEKILRELAKAGLSKRGLIVASDLRTARRVRAGLAREALLRRFRMRLAEVRAKVLAAVRRAIPQLAFLGVGDVVIFVLVDALGGSVLVAVALAVGGDIIGLVLWYAAQRRRS
jgi:Flp pilus assembly protein TadB